MCFFLRSKTSNYLCLCVYFSTRALFISILYEGEEGNHLTMTTPTSGMESLVFEDLNALCFEDKSVSSGAAGHTFSDLMNTLYLGILSWENLFIL